MADFTYTDFGLTADPPADTAHPESRLRDAIAAQHMVDAFLRNDSERRALKRKHVCGLIDGNPPNSPSKLKDAGLSPNTNINTGEARGYLESVRSSLYDLTTEAPGTVSIMVGGHWPEEKRIEWGRIMSKHADYEFEEDESWDFRRQSSDWESVLHGRGALLFDDPHAVFPSPVADRNFLMDDLEVTDTSEWEVAVVLFDYHPPRLYRRITDEKAAEFAGWRVNYTKLVLCRATPQAQEDNRPNNWEFYQNLYKVGGFTSSADSTKVCKLAHVFWREWNGRISHGIIERTGVTSPEYLYLSVGKYERFSQVLHPMYFDQGREQLHYAVTGLGVKMFGMLTLQNRLFCRLYDGALMPKVLFQTTSEEAYTKFQAMNFGDGAVLRPGVEVKQNPISGYLNEGLSLYKASDDTLRSIMSNVRQPVQPERPGNPETAFAERMKASQQSALSNTMFAMRYKQHDILYKEIVRRLCNTGSSDPRAQRFQDKCKGDGVPEEAFGKLERVRAVRVIGQGNPFMRAEMTAQILGSAPALGLPENGKQNLADDFIASRAGYQAIERYNPKGKPSEYLGDQQERASNQIGNMRQGIPPVMSPSQNAAVFGSMYLDACIAGFNSLRQGAEPTHVLAFVELAGPAAGKHIQRLAGDPRHKELFDSLEKNWKRVARMTDQLKKMVAKQQQQGQRTQQRGQQVFTDAQIDAQKAAAEINLKQQKQAAHLAMKAQAHRQALQERAQRMAITDAEGAARIRQAHLRSLSE